jgi:hypothetical protein
MGMERRRKVDVGTEIVFPFQLAVLRLYRVS